MPLVAPVAVKQTPRKLVDSTKPLIFRITAAHVAKAKCQNPNECVVAQAINDQLVDQLERIDVGTSIIKITTETKVYRYATPSRLRDCIKVFDRTKMWNLPLGEYRLNAMPRATATRQVTRSETLCVV